MSEGILVVDIETTGLKGIPEDRVLEVGIAEVKDGNVHELYASMVRYDDLPEHCREKGEVWVFSHSDLRLDDIMGKGKDVSAVVKETREIMRGRMVTSYNVPFCALGYAVWKNPENKGLWCLWVFQMVTAYFGVLLAVPMER